MLSLTASWPELRGSEGSRRVKGGRGVEGPSEKWEFYASRRVSLDVLRSVR